MFVRRTLVALASLALTFTTAAEGQRLPGGVHPESYKLTLTPDLKAATFSGSETIDVVLDAPSKTVTLNAAEIKFGAVKAYALPIAAYSSGKLGSQPVALQPLEADKHPQPATITLDEAKEQAT